MSELMVRDWVLYVCFPKEETGKNRKLFRSWHGPFYFAARNDRNLMVTKVYLPTDAYITVHQLSASKPRPASSRVLLIWSKAPQSRKSSKMAAETI